MGNTRAAAAGGQACDRAHRYGVTVTGTQAGHN